jgi:hypothetical protein
MKKRYIYSLLFGIPGFFAAAIITLVLFGAAAGILWLFIFGDNPWPPVVEKIIPVLIVSTFLILWMALIAAGFAAGRKLEKEPQLNKMHILISSGFTLLFVVLIALQQLSVSNLGPKSDSAICSDYCTLNGYAGSGMPPQNSGNRTCSCYDNSGKEVLKVPLSSITPDASK